MSFLIPISSHGKLWGYCEGCHIFCSTQALFPLGAFPWCPPRSKERQMCVSSDTAPAKTPQLAQCTELCLSSISFSLGPLPGGKNWGQWGWNWVIFKGSSQPKPFCGGSLILCIELGAAVKLIFESQCQQAQAVPQLLEERWGEKRLSSSFHGCWSDRKQKYCHSNLWFTEQTKDSCYQELALKQFRTEEGY